MGKAIDLTGQKFGKLTALERVKNKNVKSGTYWRCQCDCGNIVCVNAGNLKNGHTKSCGCVLADNLIGKKFGLLTVVERSGSKYGNAAWLCQCDCGNTKIVDSRSLKNNLVKSCGCLHKMADITGEKFGNLTAIRPSCYKNGYIWECKCDCGNKTNVSLGNLRNGHIKSCGCANKGIARNYIHGNSRKRIYKEYYSMLMRCKPNTKYKKDYYDRGITVCQEWIDDFQSFYDWAMANGYCDDLTIDRKDNNKGYYPDNCRWATKLQQANNRRGNLNIEYNGETHTLAEWSRKLGFSYSKVRERIKKGMEFSEAIKD